MTVSSEINKSGPWLGNNVTTAFDYAFKIVDRTHVKVIRTEGGVETVLTIDVDYDVTGVGNPEGGQILTVVAPTDEQSLTNLRAVPFTQETDLENQGAYYPETVERSLDLAAMRDQQLSERVDRSVRIPASADPSRLDDLVADILRLSESADNIDIVAGLGDDIATVAGVSEIIADNIVDIQNASENAEAAIAARDEAAASAALIENQANQFDSVAMIAATNVPAGVQAVRPLGFSTVGDGGGALYKRVGAEPSHAGKRQSADGSWWELVETTIAPEMFGKIGVNEAGDTAAWTALASYVNAYPSRPIAIVCRSPEYLISGTGANIVVVSDVRIEFDGAVFRQQSAFSKTFRFENCKSLVTRGGTFYGYADIEIANSQTPSEYNGASSSYNGVAAIFTTNCDDVQIEDAREYRHAGGVMFLNGGRRHAVRRLVAQGIGYPYIDPIGQGNQGNGHDFAINSWLVNNADAWKTDVEISDCRIRDHAFGGQVVAPRTLQMHGNDIGPCPGQHGFYTIEGDGLDITGNTFRDTRQFGFKNQYENYSGRFLGAAWQPSTAYVVGDVVRSSAIPYVCKTAHTSGGAFSDTNWDIHPKYYRDGGIITNNSLIGCGNAIGIVSTSESSATAIHTRNLMVYANRIVDSSSAALSLDRCLDADIANNIFVRCGSTSGYSNQLKDFSGSVRGNRGIGCRTALFGVFAVGDIFFEENFAKDCGLLGADTVLQTPLIVTIARDGNTIPGQPATTNVYARRNEVRYSSTPSAPYILFDVDANQAWSVEDTRCARATAQIGRIAGTLAVQFRNDFLGWYAGGQAETTFSITNDSTRTAFNADDIAVTPTNDVLATLLRRLADQRIIRVA